MIPFPSNPINDNATGQGGVGEAAKQMERSGQYNTAAYHVVIPTQLTLPLPPLLTPVEVLEQACQITPESIPLHDRQGRGAELFAKMCDSDLVLLDWPDGVRIAVFSACLTPDAGLWMYFHGRKVLEEHVARLERRV